MLRYYRLTFAVLLLLLGVTKAPDLARKLMERTVHNVRYMYLYADIAHTLKYLVIHLVLTTCLDNEVSQLSNITSAFELLG